MRRLQPRRTLAIFVTSVVPVFVTFVAAAQQQSQPIFRASTRLIIETVTVTDKDGKAIEGLTASDFIVTEDNVPQQIAFVEFQRMDGGAHPAPMPPVKEVAADTRS